MSLQGLRQEIERSRKLYNEGAMYKAMTAFEQIAINTLKAVEEMDQSMTFCCECESMKYQDLFDKLTSHYKED